LFPTVADPGIGGGGSWKIEEQNKIVYTKRRIMGVRGLLPRENFWICGLLYVCFSAFWKLENYYF